MLEGGILLIRNMVSRWARAPYLPKFVPDANTVLWLPGQDDNFSSTVRDRSGQGSNGTITGATWVRDSYGLWELEYDGTDDNVDLTNNSLYNFTAGDFSGCCWIYPTDVTNLGYLLSRGSANVEGWNFAVHQTGLLQFITSQSPGQQTSRSSASSIVVNTRYFVAWSRSGTSARVYINGIEDTDVAETHTDPETNTRSLFIGQERASGVNEFTGIISLPRIFSRNVPASEWKSIYREERGIFRV